MHLAPTTRPPSEGMTKMVANAAVRNSRCEQRLSARSLEFCLKAKVDQGRPVGGVPQVLRHSIPHHLDIIIPWQVLPG
jgi:hypothetical protein